MTLKFGILPSVSSDIGQTNTLEKGLKSGRDMCAPHREIELLVKLITFLLQIYFQGTRRGSDKVPIPERESCDQDIVMGKALREDKALNAVYFEKME